MMPEAKLPQPATSDWRSPWPYDFPAESGSETDAQVDRLKPKDRRKPLAVSRRGLFTAGFHAWAAFATAGAVGTVGLVRFLFPNVSFEKKQIFLTDKVSAFDRESVSENWKESDDVWMVNTGGKLMAISTVCTHLGCTPNWLAGDRKFKCPCHGSGYYIDGVNFEGPTPRPLERFGVSVDLATGRVLVDKTVKCQVEQGTCLQRQFYIPTA